LPRPAAQFEQSVPPVEYLPRAHTAQLAPAAKIPDPSITDFPAAQFEHASPPIAHVPTRQLVQLAPAAKIPDPAATDFPASQFEHAVVLTAPEYFPAEHVKQAELSVFIL